MRVLHALRADHATHIGGDNVMLHAQVRALQALGVDAFAAVIGSASGSVQAPDIVHLYNLDRPAALGRDVRRARTLWPDARIVLSTILFPWPWSDVVHAADPAVWWRGAKTGIKIRATSPANRLVLTAVDGVLPGSPGERRRLGRYFALRPGRHWIPVPCGVWCNEWPEREKIERADQLAALGFDPGLERLIACVARIDPRKNQMALVEAIAHRPNMGLVLIGPVAADRYGTRVTARIEADLAGRAAWIGPRSQAEVAAILRGVDVHVLPSFWESPGLTSLEAAAVGCEVVVTTGGAPLEYFGEDAHVARSPNWRDVGVAIDQALTSPRQPGLRRRMEDYDWSRTGEILADAYAQVLAAPRRRSHSGSMTRGGNSRGKTWRSNS